MSRTLSTRMILTAAFVAQLLSAPLLWSHTSTPADVFGRYSTRYALVLAVHVALGVGWGAVALIPRWVERTLARLPRPLLWGGVGVMVLGMGAVWATSLAVHVLAYLSLNALLLIIVLAGALDTPEARRTDRLIMIGLAGVMVLPLLLTALTVQGFHPDEAHYTDYASTFMAEGMLYDSSWLETPYKIEPGWPWALAAYGWLVEQVGYTVYVGRVLNFISYLLCFAGLYAVGAHLYGRDAGLLAAVTAYLSIAFIPEWDYSPNHLLTPVGAWSLYLLARAAGARRGWLLYALVGLIATLSLNVHAAGVVFALGYSLWMAWRVVWGLFGGGSSVTPIPDPSPVNRGREQDAGLYVGGFKGQSTLIDAVAFGMGALLGTFLYYLTNIAPVGGVDVYLSVLREWDGSRRNPLFFYRWESLAERLLILAAVVWLAWRRTPSDRFVLSAVGFTVIAAVLMDTQGYIWHFGPFYFIALGVFFAQAFGGRRAVVSVAVVWLFAVQVSGAFVDWGTVRQFVTTRTVPTYLYNDLKPILPDYVTEDDVIYTTHQLIWVFPHTSRPNIITYGAEREGMQRYGLTKAVDVWETVQPTVIIFIEGQMNYDPGMVAYLERHPFGVCASFTVQGTQVTVSRPDCTNTEDMSRCHYWRLMEN